MDRKEICLLMSGSVGTVSPGGVGSYSMRWSFGRSSKGVFTPIFLFVVRTTRNCTKRGLFRHREVFPKSHP